MALNCLEGDLPLRQLSGEADTRTHEAARQMLALRRIPEHAAQPRPLIAPAAIAVMARLIPAILTFIGDVCRGHRKGENYCNHPRDGVLTNVPKSATSQTNHLAQ